ncbi:von Willebrand factor type A [Spirochaeta thermophila DSM 6578]|uniref:von Willebrand factor type A n=1 Tax=Winmispira thermophila (strain ATCC 700085 / DSM 6578 / Z-1203) TaxID=869211 RepID=G0GBY9_WINT7|nr:DUF58 domain-containing protein [Spirochaeta thermophila]AEJ62000.1 von Willebrand factor type A [Spirochaeta thermophila DSM 6578]
MDPFRLRARIRQLSLFSDIILEGLYAGNYRSVFKGQGMDFQEVRTYVPGDDVRLIDWNVTSRFGEPHTKVFREERELVLFLVVDVSRSMRSGSNQYSKFDCLEILFSIFSLVTLENNDRVGALFFTDEVEDVIPPRKGKTHVLALLRRFRDMRPRGRGSDLALALRTARDLLPRRSMCVVLSDFRSAGFLDDLLLLRAHHDLFLVRIGDALDREFPPTGYVELLDPETGTVLPAFGRSGKFRQWYRRYWEFFDRLLTEECARGRIPLLDMSTSEDPVVQLKRFFSRRRR